VKALLEISRKLAENYIKYENFTKITKCFFFTFSRKKSQEIKNSIYKMKNFKMGPNIWAIFMGFGLFLFGFYEKRKFPVHRRR
jgi:hypothetical protein